MASHQDGTWQSGTTLHTRLETSRREALTARTSTGPPLVPLYTDPSAWEANSLLNEEGAPPLDTPLSLPHLCSNYYERVPRVSEGGRGVHSSPINSFPGAEVCAMVQSQASLSDSDTYLIIARTDGSVTVQPPPGSYLSQAGHEGLTLRIFSPPPPLDDKCPLPSVLLSPDLAAHATVGGKEDAGKEWRDNLVFATQGGVLLPPVAVAPHCSSDGWPKLESERGLLLVAASVCVGCVTLDGQGEKNYPYTPVPPTSVIRVLHLPKEALLVGGNFSITTTESPTYRPSTSLSSQKRGEDTIAFYDAYGKMVLNKKSEEPTLAEFLPPPRWLSSVILPTGVTVRALDVSSDGRYILASCSDARARVYLLQEEVITPPPLPPALAAMQAKEDTLFRELSSLKLTSATSFTRLPKAVSVHNEVMDGDDEKDEAVIKARAESVKDGEDARVAAKWASLPLPKEPFLVFTAAPPSADPLTAGKAQVPIASSSTPLIPGIPLNDSPIPLHLSWQWECRRVPTSPNDKLVAKAHGAALEETSGFLTGRAGSVPFSAPSTQSSSLPSSHLQHLGSHVLSTTGVFLWWNVMSHNTKSSSEAVRASAHQSCMQHIQRHPLPATVSLCSRSAAHHSFTPLTFPLSAVTTFPSPQSHVNTFSSTPPSPPLPSLARPFMLTGDTQGNVMAWEVPTMPLKEAVDGLEASSLGALLPIALIGKHTLHPSAASLDGLSSTGGSFTPEENDAGIASPPPSSAVTSLAISPCGAWGISGTSCGQVYMYQLANLGSKVVDLTPPKGGFSGMDSVTSLNNNMQLGMFGGKMSPMRGPLDHLHAARWDGVGAVKRVAFLRDAPNFAVCEVGLLGKEGESGQRGRTLFVYDLPTGSLACRLELEMSSEDMSSESETRMGSSLPHLMPSPPSSAPQWQSLPRGVLRFSSTPPPAFSVLPNEGHGYIMHLTHTSVSSILAATYPQVSAALYHLPYPVCSDPLNVPEIPFSLPPIVPHLPSILATDLLGTALKLCWTYAAESTYECLHALSLLSPHHARQGEGALDRSKNSEIAGAEGAVISSVRVGRGGQQRIASFSRSPTTSHPRIDPGGSGVFGRACLSTRVGMGLVGPDYLTSDPRPHKGPRSPCFSIPTSPRNKMWGGEVEEQMAGSINLCASSSPSLSSMRANLRIFPAASQAVNAVAITGRYVPGPGGGGGRALSESPPAFSTVRQVPLVPPLFSAERKVRGDHPFSGSESTMGTAELALLFSRQRGEGRAGRGGRIGRIY